MATQSFRRILEILEAHGVEYVVVGGVAAVLHGAPVTTFDIDALVRVDSDNSERLLSALAELDARFREHGTLRPTAEDLAAGGHLLLLTNSGPLDVLGFIGGGKRYEDVAATAQRVRIGGMSIRVLSLEALLDDKRALGRDKDLPVVRLLEALLERRRGG
jgi:predicted nucleotidyltransferase